MRLRNLLALDDGIEGGGAAEDVVRLDGEHFTQCVPGTVSEERPDFHFSEALASVLSLTAERLLGDERVWTDRAHVDLVFDHVVKFEDIHVADSDILIELFSGAAVKECHFAVLRNTGLDELFLDFGFGRSGKRRYDSLIIQGVSSETEMHLENLS